MKINIIFDFTDPSIPEVSTNSYTHMAMETERIGLRITWQVSGHSLIHAVCLDINR